MVNDVLQLPSEVSLSSAETALPPPVQPPVLSDTSPAELAARINSKHGDRESDSSVSNERATPSAPNQPRVEGHSPQQQALNSLDQSQGPQGSSTVAAGDQNSQPQDQSLSTLSKTAVSTPVSSHPSPSPALDPVATSLPRSLTVSADTSDASQPQLGGPDESRKAMEGQPSSPQHRDSPAQSTPNQAHSEVSGRDEGSFEQPDPMPLPESRSDVTPVHERQSTPAQDPRQSPSQHSAHSSVITRSQTAEQTANLTEHSERTSKSPESVHPRQGPENRNHSPNRSVSRIPDEELSAHQESSAGGNNTSIEATAHTPQAPKTVQAAQARRVMPIAPAPITRGPSQSPIAGASDTSSPSMDSQRFTSEHQECSNCKTTRTPLWRRGPNGQNLCNACGLYVKARNINRPVTLKRSPVTRTIPLQSMMGSCPGDGRCNGTGGSESCPQCPSFNNNRLLQAQKTSDNSTVNMVSCQNCGTVTTPLWRRDSQGHIICNACGLYNRIHKDSRPSDLRTTVIKRRRRNTHASSDSTLDEPLSSTDTHESRTQNTTPVSKMSRVPSPSRSPRHSQSPQSTESLCCTHISPAIQPPYPPPMYGPQGMHSGSVPPQPQPQGPPQAPKSGSVPFGFIPMGHNAPMGLSMMLPPPTQGYMGQPWPMQPPLGGQYPYPQQFALQPHGPPPPVRHPAASDAQGAWHQISQQGTSHQATPRQSLSPQGTPRPVQAPNAQQAPNMSQYQPEAQGREPSQVQGQAAQKGLVPPHPSEASQTTPPQAVARRQPDASDKDQTKMTSPTPGHSLHAAKSGEQGPAAVDFTHSFKPKEGEAKPLSELVGRRSSESVDSADSPLAVLHYLQGASKDTVSEYLLAAQRQLNDKVYQLRRQLGRAEFQLKECEDALKKINQDDQS